MIFMVFSLSVVAEHRRPDGHVKARAAREPDDPALDGRPGGTYIDPIARKKTKAQQAAQADEDAIGETGGFRWHGQTENNHPDHLDHYHDPNKQFQSNIQSGSGVTLSQQATDNETMSDGAVFTAPMSGKKRGDDMTPQTHVDKHAGPYNEWPDGQFPCKDTALPGGVAADSSQMAPGRTPAGVEGSTSMWRRRRRFSKRRTDVAMIRIGLGENLKRNGSMNARACVIDIPSRWNRVGRIVSRAAEGDGSHVVGDPCIVFDPAIGNWRMFLFHDPPGHGHATCTGPDPLVPNAWKLVGALTFANPEAMLDGSTHKPYVVMEADRPNHAARIEGRYCLVSISRVNGHKIAQQAWATNLAGPWTWQTEPLMPLGGHGDVDEKHIDAISGLYFAERREILFFYMGYPDRLQAHRPSPLGSCQAAAVQKVGLRQARKLGVVLPPSLTRGHWAGGWVGGLQAVPGAAHRWIAVANASPTAPSADDKARSREEPPPSLGGFACCDEEFPDRGWQWCDQPIERIEDIPEAAVADGEGVNLWRQHLLVLPDGRLGLFYNSGPYGQEQLYAKWAQGPGDRPVSGDSSDAREETDCDCNQDDDVASTAARRHTLPGRRLCADGD